jgi:hypothetical protein
MIHFRLCLHLICPGGGLLKVCVSYEKKFHLGSRRMLRRLIVFKLNSLRSILLWKNGLEKRADIPQNHYSK